MKRTFRLLAPLFIAILATGLGTTTTTFAATPTVTVSPPAPPAGPIPIPYPNLHATAPQANSALEGFFRAERASGGVIQVVSIDTVD